MSPFQCVFFVSPEKYSTFLNRDCGAGKITAAVSSSGNIRACTHTPEVYGNVLQEDLKRIWKRMSPWRNGSYAPSECASCKDSSYCSMGCRESAKIKGGKIDFLDPWAIPKNAGNRKTVFKKTELEGEYRLAPDLMFRNEGEEKLIYSPRSMSIGLVNNDFFNIIISLKNQGRIDLSSAVNVFGENADRILRYLNSKRFIIREDK